MSGLSVFRLVGNVSVQNGVGVAELATVGLPASTIRTGRFESDRLPLDPVIVGNLTPASNVTYDLGSSTHRWKDLWLSGNTIHLGDTTIGGQGGNVAIGNVVIAGTSILVDGAPFGSLSGNGAALTSLNASELTGGTLDNARLPATISVTSVSGNGAGLTALDASELTSGIVSDARISGAYTGFTTLETSGDINVGGNIHVISGNVAINNILDQAGIFSVDADANARPIIRCTATEGYPPNILQPPETLAPIKTRTEFVVGTDTKTVTVEGTTQTGSPLRLDPPQYQGRIELSTTHWRSEGTTYSNNYAYEARVKLNEIASISASEEATEASTTPRRSVRGLHIQTSTGPGYDGLNIWDGTLDETLYTRMFVSGIGNVGIGTTDPQYQLQLSTNSAAKPSTNTWTVASDRRLKANIEIADEARCIDIVKSLPLQRFEWTPSYIEETQERDHGMLGWIAQDVANVFPKAITITKGYGLKDCHALDVDQLYKVTYGALRKVIADNENLVEKIHTLEERIMTLENAS